MCSNIGRTGNIEWRIIVMQRTGTRNFKYFYLENDSVLNPGDKVVLLPPDDMIYKHFLGDRVSEDFGFYPGMIMTVKSVKKDQWGTTWVYFREVSLPFKIIGFVPLDGIKEEDRLQIVKWFQEMWYKKKFLFFKFRAGQKVVFLPRNLTKIWFEKDYNKVGLVSGNIYEIKSILARRWLMLDEREFNVHWMDVKKYRPYKEAMGVSP